MAYLAELEVRLGAVPQAAASLAEIRDHLDESYHESLRAGVAPDEAARQAVRRLGPAADLARELRAAAASPWRVCAAESTGRAAAGLALAAVAVFAAAVTGFGSITLTIMVGTPLLGAGAIHLLVPFLALGVAGSWGLFSLSDRLLHGESRDVPLPPATSQIGEDPFDWTGTRRLAHVRREAYYFQTGQWERLLALQRSAAVPALVPPADTARRGRAASSLEGADRARWQARRRHAD